MASKRPWWPPNTPIRIPGIGVDVYFVDLRASFGSESPEEENAGRILCSSADGTIRVVVDHLKHPFGLDIHLASETIYWTDLADCNINACNLKGESRRVVVHTDPDYGDFSAPKQIAIDQLKSQIYWTQTDGTLLLRSNLDGSSIEAFFEGNTPEMSTPKVRSHHLVLDSQGRQIFWSASGLKDQKYFILRASMDLPSSITASTPAAQWQDIIVVYKDLPEIRGIDFIPLYGELYWSALAKDRGLFISEIYRADAGLVEEYEDNEHRLVIDQLSGMGCFKVDPKPLRVYTECMEGVLVRYNVAPGYKDEQIIFEDFDAAITNIALMEVYFDPAEASSSNLMGDDEEGRVANGAEEASSSKPMVDDEGAEEASLLKPMGDDEGERVAMGAEEASAPNPMGYDEGGSMAIRTKGI